MSRACDYSDNSPPPTSDDFATLRQQVQDLEARLSERQTQNRGSSDGSSGGIFSATPPSSHSGRQLTAAMLGISANNWRTSNAFPAIFFLDSEAFDYAHLTVPKPHMLVWAEVLECLGDVSAVQALVSTYFTSIHLWLPIVSKKRLYQILSNALTEPGPDLALLLLCMKLIATPPDDFGMESPQTYCYSMAKRFYSAVEQNGTYSIHLLQAAVLIGLYEVGHAIYPAAYLTVGHCARMGYAMGIHRRKDLPQMLNRPSTWTDVEERGRVWWAVLILDRYVNLGFIGRPLATEDPSRDDYLPVDENKWDEGDMAVNEFLVVSSATSLKASSFARTCQATNLLGRIIRHINDRTLDLPFRFEEALQLNRTVQALSALLASECTTSRVKRNAAKIIWRCKE
ncbi:MAG: hypothetical protein M1827_006161 [Pycnora praestabilis]|nr:MAG: hypothetical protein M1827_006161 [Pycnora praestabilis]